MVAPINFIRTNYIKTRILNGLQNIEYIDIKMRQSFMQCANAISTKIGMTE